MTRRLMISFILVLSAGPAFAQGSSRSSDSPKIHPATVQSYTVLNRYTQMDGLVMSATPREITLRVGYTPPIGADTSPTGPTAELQRRLVQLRQSQISYARSRNAAEARSRLARIRTQARQIESLVQRIRFGPASGTVASEYIDFELPLANNAVVRKLSRGVEYDDKGFPKPQNDPAGRGGMVGYPAKISELIPGAQVTVSLLRSYGTIREAPKTKDANGAILDLPPVNRPQVRAIVMTTDEFGAPVVGSNRLR